MFDLPIRLDSPPFVSTPDDLERVESRFRVRLPDDHRDLLSKLGGGKFDDVRVLRPEMIEFATMEARELCARFWFWGDDSDLRRQVLTRGLVVGDNANGDVLWAIDRSPGRFVILGTDSSQPEIFERVGDAIRALFASPPRELVFKPQEPVADEASHIGLITMFSAETTVSNFQQVCAKVSERIGLPAFRSDDSVMWDIDDATVWIQHAEYQHTLVRIAERTPNGVFEACRDVFTRDGWEAIFVRERDSLSRHDATTLYHGWLSLDPSDDGQDLGRALRTPVAMLAKLEVRKEDTTPFDAFSALETWGLKRIQDNREASIMSSGASLIWAYAGNFRTFRMLILSKQRAKLDVELRERFSGDGWVVVSHSDWTPVTRMALQHDTVLQTLVKRLQTAN